MKKEISTLDELIEAASYITNADEIDTIKKAYEFAYNVHKGEKRLSGDDYILHPSMLPIFLQVYMQIVIHLQQRFYMM